MNDTANPEARKPEAGTPVSRRRTFAIISHPDAGKTTLTEKLLLFGGAIQLAGEVKAKKNGTQTRSDWMGIERERGISVVTSVMTFEYGDCVFNLLDTPGHEDFSEDTYRTLTAVDSAVMVIDAAKGIEARTRKLFEVCRLRDIPIVTFINKMDRESARPLRPARRDREDAGARHRARHLADRPRPQLRRHLRSASRNVVRRLDHDEAPMPVSGPDDPTPCWACCPSTSARPGSRRSSLAQEALPAVRPGGLPRGAPDAGVLRQRAAQFRRPRPHRRACRLSPRRRAASRPTGAWSRRTRTAMTGFVFKIQANMDPEPPRPHRLHARLLGQAHARHEGQAGAHRQADQPHRAAVLLRPQPRHRRRGLGRRRGRHPQPRHAAHRRHADRGRGPRVPRRAELRAGNPAPHQAARRHEGQEAARGAAADGARRAWCSSSCRNDGSGAIVGVVGALQLDVLAGAAPGRIRPARSPTSRPASRSAAGSRRDDQVELDKFMDGPQLLHRHATSTARPVFMAASAFQLRYDEERWPKIKFSDVKDYQVRDKAA